MDTELNDTITDESLQGFVEKAKKMQSLRAKDIAEAILYAVSAPPYVNVNEGSDKAHDTGTLVFCLFSCKVF